MFRFCPTRGGEHTRSTRDREIGLFEVETGFLSFEAVVGVLTAREPRTRLGVVFSESSMLVNDQLGDFRSWKKAMIRGMFVCCELKIALFWWNWSSGRTDSRYDGSFLGPMDFDGARDMLCAFVVIMRMATPQRLVAINAQQWHHNNNQSHTGDVSPTNSYCLIMLSRS